MISALWQLYGVWISDVITVWNEQFVIAMKKRFCFCVSFIWSVPIISGPKLPLLFGLFTYQRNQRTRRCGDLQSGPSLCLSLPLLFCIFCILRDFKSASVLHRKLQFVFITLFLTKCPFCLFGLLRFVLWFESRVSLVGTECNFDFTESLKSPSRCTWKVWWNDTYFRTFIITIWSSRRESTAKRTDSFVISCVLIWVHKLR